MAETGIRSAFELTTRGVYAKVDCEVGIKVKGKELPNMAVLGTALEEAIELIQKIVTDSYKVVPERTTPVEGVTLSAPQQ
jgi:hypothetical protein